MLSAHVDVFGVVGVVVFSLVVLIATLIYIWPSQNELTVPGPDPVNKTVGNLPQIKEAGGLPLFLDEIHERFGPIVSFWLGPELTVSIGNSKLFKETMHIFDRPASFSKMALPLITWSSIQFANGVEGQRRRKQYDAGFSHEMMRGFFGILFDVVHEYAEELRNKVQASGGNFCASIQDITNLSAFRCNLFYSACCSDFSLRFRVLRYTVSRATHTLWYTSFGRGYLTEQEEADYSEKYDYVWDWLENQFMGIAPSEEENKKATECIEWIHNIGRRLIEERHRDPSTEGTRVFLDMLLESGAPDDVILADTVTYLLAGYHTSATMLSWAFFYLLHAPESMQRLVAELDANLEKERGEISFETLSDYKYTKQVINETLRTSRLAPIAGRFCSQKEITIGGYNIPKGVPVIQALCVSLYDKKVFPNPKHFDPDRMSEEKLAAMPSCAFEPFGFAGKRKCPGYRFSFLEGYIFLSAMLTQFEFRLVDPEQKVGSKGGFVTKPGADVFVNVSLRQKE